ncbi:MAG: UpxY family transcription antiterminator [Odoribacter sp.]
MNLTDPPLYWFALRTRHQHEKRVVAHLTSLGVTCYAPFRTERRQWSDRMQSVEVPLIPSLVFVHTTFDDANTLLSDPVLSVNYMIDTITGQRLVVPDRQMELFMRLTQLQQEGLTLLDNHLKPGDRVRVIEGEFKGIEGELIRIKGHKRVVVRLEGLFALATTYIPGEYLERIYKSI